VVEFENAFRFFENGFPGNGQVLDPEICETPRSKTSQMIDDKNA
jgi:hypothetical protein